MNMAGIIPALAEPPPTLRAKNPKPKRTKPNPNLYGAAGSLFMFDSLIHNHEKMGANIMIKKGLKD